MSSQELCRYYIGETACRVNERIVDHTGTDTNSHLLKHSIESGHKPLEAVDYKIISMGYRKNTMIRKLSEALFIPFRTTRFLPVQKLSFFQILLPLGYKTICRCPHVNTTCSFQDIFGDTGVPMILKGNKPCLCNNGI